MRLSDLTPAALILITVIVIAFVGADVLTSFYKNQVDTVSVVNESITGSSSSYVNLAYTLKSVSEVWGYNGTDWNQLSTPADYNVSLGVLETGYKGGIKVSATYDGQPVNVSYIGYADSYASNVSKSGLNAETEIANWTPTVALIIAAAIIIGVVIGAFAAFKREE